MRSILGVFLATIITVSVLLLFKQLVFADTNVVTDSFTRTVNSGWGTATSGQAYSTTGGNSTDYNVTGSVGTILTTAASASRETILSTVSVTESSALIKVKANNAPVGGSPEVQVIARRVASNTNYRIRLIFASAGTMNLTATRVVSGTTSTLGTQANIAITPTADQYYWFKAEAVGTSPTTIRSKVWADGDTEPATWQFSTTDAQAELQVAAAVGFRTNVPAGVSSLPWVFSFDALEVNDTSAIAPTPTPTPTPSPSPTPTAAPTSTYTSDDFIQAVDQDLVYKGEIVHLQGTNFDNVPALGASIGSGSMSSIQIHEEDYVALREKGGNHARLGLSFNWYQNDRTAFLAMLDQHIAWARENHIWLVLNMFTTPGDCYEGYSTQCGFWASSSEQQELQDFWVDIAQHYAGEPVIAGYGLLNEPTPPAPNYCSTWFDIASNIRDAMYAVAPNQLVFIAACSDPGNSLRYRNPPFGENIVYEVHDYTPTEMTTNSSLTYPGQATDWYNTCTYNKDAFQGIAQVGDPAGCAAHTDLQVVYGLDWADTNNVPIYIGEWGATSSLTGYVQFHQDKAELYRDWGVHSAHYTWKHRTSVTGGSSQWGIYSNVFNLDEPLKLAAVQISWTGAVFPDFTPPTSAVSSSATSSNNSSSGSTNSPPPGCSDVVPQNAPYFFQLDRLESTAALYVTPPSREDAAYVIAYGLNDVTEQFGTSFMVEDTSGAIKYEIRDLDPKATYSFKIRAQNGCMPGPWSHTLKAAPSLTRTRLVFPGLIKSFFK